MEGFTDIFVTGKGFASNIADKAKCRFGVDGSYAVTDAEVLDYTKLVCRSPEAIFKLVDSVEVLSVPFSISFGEQENKPWTQDLHRYRFYKQPYLAYAIPDEIDVRKKAEIYVYPEEGYSFLQRKLCFDTLFAFSGSNWSIRNVRLPWNRWCQLFIW